MAHNLQETLPTSQAQKYFKNISVLCLIRKKETHRHVCSIVLLCDLIASETT